MKIISKENILLNQNLNTKDQVFELLVSKASELNIINDKNIVLEDLYKRENQSSTGLENGFAIPHCQSQAINKVAILIIRLANDGINDWETFDDSKVKFIISLFIPKTNENNIHLLLLSKIAESLMDDEFQNKLILAKKEEQIIEAIEKIVKN